METNNAKHFAIQLGALISLYVSAGALIQLLFGLITIFHPDALNMPWEAESATGSIRIAIALLVVFFPAYLALTRTINTARRTHGSTYLPLTKWLIYLSLLVGGLLILGDLVTIIYNFLNGELTTRFLLKALTVLGVVGAAFAYYAYDAKEYWHTHETQSKQYALGMIVVVILSIIFGYMHIEAPAEVRERIADDREISDLVTIQSYVMNHYAINAKLPASLTELELYDALPEAPEGRPAYVYERVSDDNFKLCATFALASTPNGYAYPSYPMYETKGAIIRNPDDWNHSKGAWCFTRVVDIPSPTAPTTY